MRAAFFCRAATNSAECARAPAEVPSPPAGSRYGVDAESRCLWRNAARGRTRAQTLPHRQVQCRQDVWPPSSPSREGVFVCHGEGRTLRKKTIPFPPGCVCALPDIVDFRSIGDRIVIPAWYAAAHDSIGFVCGLEQIDRRMAIYQVCSPIPLQSSVRPNARDQLLGASQCRPCSAI